MRRKRLTITLRNDILNKIDKTIDGNVVRNRSHAIESILVEKLKSCILEKAVILGGGYGIALGGKTIPKLLFPIGGETLVEKNIKTLREHGITQLIISPGEMTEQVRKKLGNGSSLGVKITYLEKDTGNADVIRQAKKLMEETFLVMNGDILLDTVDIEDMYDFHKKNGGKATVLVATVNDPSALGAIRMKGNLITHFTEKPGANEPDSYLINGGVYLLEPEISYAITSETHYLEKGVFPVIAQESKLYGYSIGDRWIHLHNKERYLEYIKSLKNKHL